MKKLTIPAKLAPVIMDSIDMIWWCSRMIIRKEHGDEGYAAAVASGVGPEVTAVLQDALAIIADGFCREHRLDPYEGPVKNALRAYVAQVFASDTKPSVDDLFSLLMEHLDRWANGEKNFTEEEKAAEEESRKRRFGDKAAILNEDDITPEIAQAVLAALLSDSDTANLPDGKKIKIIRRDEVDDLDVEELINMLQAILGPDLDPKKLLDLNKEVDEDEGES